MYHQFNIQQFYVLSTQCFCVFCVGLRTNRDYFTVQHYLTGFYNRDLTQYSPVVIIFTTSFTCNNCTFCLRCVVTCFVWIWEQTAIISLYSIIWFIQFLLMFVVKAALSDALCRQFPGLFCNVLLLVDLTSHAAYLWIELGFGTEAGATCFRHNSHSCLKRLRKPIETAKKTASPVWS